MLLMRVWGIVGEAIVSDLYCERAAECMKLSVISCDTAIRDGYRELAEAYLKLANGGRQRAGNRLRLHSWIRQ
jgi:hypothetical protein